MTKKYQDAFGRGYLVFAVIDPTLANRSNPNRVSHRTKKCCCHRLPAHSACYPTQNSSHSAFGAALTSTTAGSLSPPRKRAPTPKPSLRRPKNTYSLTRSGGFSQAYGARLAHSRAPQRHAFWEDVPLHVGKARKDRAVELYTIKVPHVCAECNNGWMSNLQNGETYCAGIRYRRMASAQRYGTGDLSALERNDGD